MAKERILLAYSGGLDTSIIIPWLKENYDCDVIAMAGELGIGEDEDFLREKGVEMRSGENLYRTYHRGVHPRFYLSDIESSGGL